MKPCEDCKYFLEPDTCYYKEADTWGDPKESSAIFQRSLGKFGLWWYHGCGKEGRFFDCADELIKRLDGEGK